MLIDADLKSARTLDGSGHCILVSFIIGGVMLSTVGLVCAIVGFVKIKHVIDDVDGRQKVYATVRQTLIWVSPSAPLRSSSTSSASRLAMPGAHGGHATGDFTSILGEGAIITAQPSDGSGNA